MPLYLGIDTSNYTTSIAVFDCDKAQITHRKKLLPVKEGSIGLSQGEAVFAHVKQFPQIIEEIFACINSNTDAKLKAVGMSCRPRSVEGSYMPCFKVGELVGRTVAAASDVKNYTFSHQSGHIAAALYSTERMDLYDKEFIAFHFSGGTTECLYVTPDTEEVFNANIIGQSLDLKCGQAIDRVGTMLGMRFPAGQEMDELSQKSNKKYKVKPTFKDQNCCISGLENQCKKMFESGENKEDIAKYCIDYVCGVVEKMLDNIPADLKTLPIIFSGGVMSNSTIRQEIGSKYDGYFAKPEFSSDNAAGIAVMTSIKDGVYFG